MPKIAYETKRFSKTKLATIARANTIIAIYKQQGLDLSLRQLFYQFVSKNLIANTEREYKNLGVTISDGRMAGLIDWKAIVDRTRAVEELAHWESPQDIIDMASRQFRTDKWATQPYYVEVWIEKIALIGVIERVCKEFDVPYLACKGYASISEVWRAGHERIKPQADQGKKIKILYLGDHDPSGIDMTRDVQDRLSLFSAAKVSVDRLALTQQQIRQYLPPPNPTKLTDSRAADYVAQFGNVCWELDALDPRVIADLIRKAILKIRDKKEWDRAIRKEKEHRYDLQKVVDRWDNLVELLHAGDW